MNILNQRQLGVIVFAPLVWVGCTLCLFICVDAGNVLADADAALGETWPQPQEIALPGIVNQVAKSGDDRYLCLGIPSRNEISVFDLHEARIVGTIPYDGELAIFAADQSHLFVVDNRNHTIGRWSLAKLEREARSLLPFDDSVDYVLVGRLATSQLLLVTLRKPPHLVDSNTLQIMLVPEWDNWSARKPQQTQPLASADGSTYLLPVDGAHGPANIIHIDPQTHKPTTLNINIDSFYFLDSNFHWPLAEESTPHLPCTQGIPVAGTGLALLLTHVNVKPPKIEFAAINDHRSVLVLPPDPTMAAIRSDTLPLSSRITYSHSDDLMVMIPKGEDRLLLRKINLLQHLKSMSIDYLFVRSLPLGSAEAGKQYQYPMVIESSRGNVRCSLLQGPPGMNVTQEGVIEWPTPTGSVTNPLIRILLHDQSGQQVVHEYFLHIDDGKNREEMQNAQ